MYILPFKSDFRCFRSCRCVFILYLFFWCCLALFTVFTFTVLAFFAYDYLTILFFWDICLYGYVVAWPTHKFGAGKSFDFKPATVFVLDNASQSTKKSRNAKNFGGIVSLGPLPTPICAFFREGRLCLFSRPVDTCRVTK